MFRKHKKLAVFMFILFALSAAGAAGYILAANEPRVVEEAPKPSDVPAGADDARIEKGASVDWDYEYSMCGHHIYLHCEADESIVGLTFSELQASSPDMRIVSFEPKKLTLKKSFECYCPRHYILRRLKDKLAVFRTVLGTPDQEVCLEVPMLFSSINKDEQQALEVGKLFDSLENIEHYLENLDT
ncbi:MAG: hypothetical protein ACM3S4_03360 [Burkholderiales bacterium]